MYTEFLYHEFLYTFRFVFRVPKPNGLYYYWDDQIYAQFMIALMRNLEPRHEEKNTILYNELEEIHEILFQ